MELFYDFEQQHSVSIKQSSFPAMLKPLFQHSQIPATAIIITEPSQTVDDYIVVHRRNSDSYRELDRSGSPLKLDDTNIPLSEILEETLWTSEEAEYVAFGGERFRTALQLLDRLNELPLTSPVMCIFNGSNPLKVHIMGSLSTTDFSRLQIKVHGWIDRKHTYPQQMVDTHEAIKRDYDNCRTKCLVSAKYHVFGRQGLNDVASGYISLDVNWDQPTYHPSSTSLTSAILNVDSKVGHDDFHQLKSMWWDLMVLHKLIELFDVHSGHVPHAAQLPRIHGHEERKYDEALTAIDMVLENEPKDNSRSNKTNEPNDTFNINGIINDLRQTRDFIGRLWDAIITNINTYGDLQQSLVYVQKEICQFQLRPQIDAKNPTYFARFLSTVNDVVETMNYIDLKVMQPIEILIEMGVYKIVNDYKFIFNAANINDESIGNWMITHEKPLEPVQKRVGRATIARGSSITCQSVTLNMTKVKWIVDKMVKRHKIVHTLAFIMKNIPLNDQQFRDVSRNCVDKLGECDSADWSENVSMNIPFELENFDMLKLTTQTQWAMTLLSAANGCEVEHTFYQNVKRSFPINIAGDENAHEDNSRYFFAEKMHLLN